MHWQLFVALCCVSFNSQEVMQATPHPSPFFTLDLGPAGKLPVHPRLNHDLEYLTNNPGLLRVCGFNEEKDVFFLFAYSQQESTSLTITRELTTLQLEEEQFEIITQAKTHINPDYDLYDVGGEGPLANYLMAKGIKGNAIFLLLGRKESFYKFTPLFTSMIEGYSPNPKTRRDRVQFTGTSVVTAILMLIINLFFIWLGFREIASYSEGEE